MCYFGFASLYSQESGYIGSDSALKFLKLTCVKIDYYSFTIVTVEKDHTSL